MKYSIRRFALAGLVGLVAGCGEGVAPAGTGAVAEHPGEQTYMRFCYSCHASGMAGAPKVGVAEHWVPRVARGRDALLVTTVEGVPPGMPPRGLCAQCTEQELAAAIDYMIVRSE